MSYQVVLRLARKEDYKQRAELVHRGFSSHFWDAFWYFLLQELTLEVCVLSAAVLFIFCGVSVTGCLALLPAAALVVLLAVTVTHQVLAQKHAQSINNEMYGVVAETRGLLKPGPGQPLALLYRLDQDYSNQHEYTQVVGTVSVSEYWGPEEQGWLHALAVSPDWAGRGLGRALAAAARDCAPRRLAALAAAASLLQSPARAALAAAGWEVRGSYCRPLLGAALTLPLVRLGLDLPPV